MAVGERRRSGPVLAEARLRIAMAAAVALKSDQMVSYKQQKVLMANQFLEPFLNNIRVQY